MSSVLDVSRNPFAPIFTHDFMQKLVALYPSIGVNYPKLHSLSHLVNIIRRKSTTDNYHTGLGEALHPQSKKDYRHTNHQDNFEQQVRTALLFISVMYKS
jgi:hypothetical protein